MLPQSVAISELELDEEAKAELLAEAQLLHDEGRDVHKDSLKRFTPAPVDCLIREVSLHAANEQRRILISGEEGGLAVETSLTAGEVHVRVAARESGAA